MTVAELAAPELVTYGEVLRTLVGSQVHGLNIEGQDDRDEMGIVIPPPAYVTGLARWESHVQRTADTRARSGPDDIDRVWYSLQKFAHLAAQGNPSVVLMLYVPDDAVLRIENAGRALRSTDQRSLFMSKRLGYRTLGYARSQYQRLIGERGQMDVKRPELVEAHGYDTKYAMHVLRLCEQGIGAMIDGVIDVPVRPIARERIMEIRRGDVPFEHAQVMIDGAMKDLEACIEGSSLPDKPNFDAINWLLHDLHTEWWDARDATVQ